jgi:hypothetical protein
MTHLQVGHYNETCPDLLENVGLSLSALGLIRLRGHYPYARVEG